MTLKGSKGVMRLEEPASQPDLLSVKEVAEKASVTTQAIYQRMKKDLKPYVHDDNGRKSLSSEVLKVLTPEEDTKVQGQSDGDSALLQATLESLMEQLNTKDAQIAVYQDEVIRQNDHARVQSDKLISLVEQVNELQKNNQILLKMEQERGSIGTGGRDDDKREGFFSRLFR